MTKDDLRTGDVVVNSKGSIGFVVRFPNEKICDFIIWKRNRKGEHISKYRMLNTCAYYCNNKNMIFTDGSGRIIEVYRPMDIHNFFDIDATMSCEPYWEEAVKMTLKDIEEELGYKIKLVK